MGSLSAVPRLGDELLTLKWRSFARLNLLRADMCCLLQRVAEKEVLKVDLSGTVDLSDQQPEEIDPEDVQMLLDDPSLAPQFDEMHGAGTAVIVLASGAPMPVVSDELPAEPDAATLPPDSAPDPEDVAILINDPSLAAQFDEVVCRE